MRVLITGSDGQLGTDLCNQLNEHELVKLTIADGDVADFNFTYDLVSTYRPDFIINTAAYVRVDDCEDDPDQACRVNAYGARNMAVAAEEVGARLMHLSTDYVFGGEQVPRGKPYTEFDHAVPCNIYGTSKLAGENFVRHLCRRHMIVRTSGLFGLAGAMGKGGNFVETVLKQAKEKRELRVIDDQVFSPTYTADLAMQITRLIETQFYGVFHVTNSGCCSWYEFAMEILKQAGFKTPVKPLKTDQYPQKARRPRYSVLGNYALKLHGWDELRSWQEALNDYLACKGHIQR
jgi:dTDP-4-dehydrorhamnose reductase